MATLGYRPKISASPTRSYLAAPLAVESVSQSVVQIA